MRLSLAQDDQTATVIINGKPVTVVWTRAAARKLAERSQPLVLELELYFSCLVKKFVHFHDESPGPETVPVMDKLQLLFSVVTSMACTMDVADRAGRQPTMALETAAVRRLAPKRVHLDVARGAWVGAFWM